MASAFEQWLEKQNGIYQKSFRDQKSAVLQKGLKPDPAIAKRDGGFIVAFRHPSSISEKIEEFAKNINCLANLRPVLPYYGEIVHTTIGTVSVGPGFVVDPDKEDHQRIINALWWAVCYVFADPETCSLDIGPIEINYPEYLFNQTTVIARAEPNENFFKGIEAIKEIVKHRTVDLSPSWGAHITVARFTHNVAPGQEGLEFQFPELCKEAVVPGRSRVAAIDVGSFLVDSGGFSFRTYHRLPFVYH